MKILALMKKEFLRFFCDPRLIVTMLLPGIVIYVMYSLMGGIMWDQKAESYEFRIYLSGSSAATAYIDAAVTASGSQIELIPTDDIDGAKAEVELGEATALLVFSQGFDEAVGGYTGESAPTAKAEIYFRSADEESLAFYTIAAGVLDGYQRQFTFTSNDCSDSGDVFSSVMGNILPFIVVALIFSSCMGVTLEAIAGEKERGTLATVLVTPVKRFHIAVGKVAPLSCIALIGAVSSFLGIMLSMPKLMGLSVGEMLGSVGFTAYFLLFLLIISLVPMIVSMIAAVSTYAKSVKEATSYTSVLMIFTFVLSLVAAFAPNLGGWIAFVPVLNVVVAMQNILAMSFSLWQALASIGMNLVYTALLLFAVGKMLGSEKIMFGK